MSSNANSVRCTVYNQIYNSSVQPNPDVGGLQGDLIPVTSLQAGVGYNVSSSSINIYYRFQDLLLSSGTSNGSTTVHSKSLFPVYIRERILTNKLPSEKTIICS